MTKSFGVILLAIYLILTGILAITNVTIAFAGVVLGVLAIGAGICLLLGK
jgi:hypothetical protein